MEEKALAQTLMDQPLDQLTCRFCHEAISDDDYFCPHCGKKLKDKPVSTSIGKQIVVYLISLLLPPFGLPWAIRYLRQQDQKSKTIGYVVIALTVISIIVNIWLAYAFIQQTSQQINTDMNQEFAPIYTQ